MFAIDETFVYSSNESFASYPVIKPNRITGEGRMKFRGANKLGDKKKKVHRKIAKKSKRQNRRK